MSTVLGMLWVMIDYDVMIPYMLLLIFFTDLVVVYVRGALYLYSMYDYPVLVATA